jgi:hypothetical protein
MPYGLSFMQARGYSGQKWTKIKSQKRFLQRIGTEFNPDDSDVGMDLRWTGTNSL